MRMGLSGLNWHRFKYHFIPDSKCGYCNARREDPAHFLFICPRFADPRSMLFSRLAPIIASIDISLETMIKTKPKREKLVSILLYGSKQLSDQQNRNILKHTQYFIDITNRFR